MMGERVCTIERIQNGYTVEVCDHEQMEKNRKSGSGYKDPWKKYGFNDEAGVVKFVKEHLKALAPEPSDYDSSFKKAVAEDK